MVTLNHVNARGPSVSLHSPHRHNCRQYKLQVFSTPSNTLEETQGYSNMYREHVSVCTVLFKVLHWLNQITLLSMNADLHRRKTVIRCNHTFTGLRSLLEVIQLYSNKTVMTQSSHRRGILHIQLKAPHAVHNREILFLSLRPLCTITLMKRSHYM